VSHREKTGWTAVLNQCLGKYLDQCKLGGFCKLQEMEGINIVKFSRPRNDTLIMVLTVETERSRYS
jgi:hypothetical protein